MANVFTNVPFDPNFAKDMLIFFAMLIGGTFIYIQASWNI